MTSQLSRCSCGHPMLLHGESCRGRNHHGLCKCKHFKLEGTATLADALRPRSMDTLLALKKRLTPKPTIINIYGTHRTFNAVAESEPQRIARVHALAADYWGM